MTFVRYLVRRAVLAVLSVYAAVTATFVLSNYMWQYRLGNMLAFARWGGASPEEVAALRREFIQSRGLDDPWHVRYLDWLVDVTTLNWGQSFTYDRPVVEIIADPVATTLGYVVPGVALAMVLGVVLGVATALAKDSRFDVSTRFLAYSLLAFPAFAAVDYVTYAVTELQGPTLTQALVHRHTGAFAAVLVATSLVAGQLRFGRAASLEQTGEPFVKLLHAKGVDRLTLARHVLRNAALPIVSMSMEIIPVLTLDVFVIERVLPIDGFAAVILASVFNGDVPVLIWSAMVFIVIGITGNFLADVLYGVLDPRVRAD